jgi:hypothetical protein
MKPLRPLTRPRIFGNRDVNEVRTIEVGTMEAKALESPCYE